MHCASTARSAPNATIACNRAALVRQSGINEEQKQRFENKRMRAMFGIDSAVARAFFAIPPKGAVQLLPRRPLRARARALLSAGATFQMHA